MGWGMDLVNGVVEGAQNAGGAVVDGVQAAAGATAEGFNSACDWVDNQLTPDIRPEGTNGHQIYVWFHHGPGTGSIDDAVQGWGRVAEKHTEVSAELDGALGMMKANWQGEAADAAQSSIGPLRDSADTASSRCQEAGKALEAQSSGFNEIKKSVTDVSAEPPMMNPLTPATSAAQGELYQAQQQMNQASLRSYGDITGGNTGSVPAFDGHKEPSKPPPPPEDGGGVDGIGVDGIDDGSGSSATRYGNSSGSGVDYSTPAGTDQAGTSGHTGSGSGSSSGGNTGGGYNSGNGNGQAAGTRSSWWSQRGVVDTDAFGGDHRGSAGPGVAAGVAGAAGLVAGGAVLGGGVLGSQAGGAGISGRGITGTGTGSGAGTGTGTGTGAGGRSSSGSLPGGGRSGVGSGAGSAPSTTSATGASAARAPTSAGAPMGGAAGRGQQQGDDDTHERPDWLLDEHEPDDLFGTDERTAPPVIGITSAEQAQADQEKQQ